MFYQHWAMKTDCISVSLLIQHNFQFLLVTLYNLQDMHGNIYRNKLNTFSDV